MSASLRIEGLACERGGRRLFEGLMLSVEAGGAALVSGPNGTGKSSLLRVIAGLLEPAAGRVDATGRIALADENLALDREKRLGEALAFWGCIDGNRPDVLADLALDHLRDVPVRMLSTGQRKRATLARVLQSGADIWLLDEPLNGLDSASCTLIEAAIARHREGGGIAVIASHQPVALPEAIEVKLA